MAQELEARAGDKGVVTIAAALEVAATIIGDKPVDESDAAAIQATEMRATGATSPPVSGVGIEAQAAAMANARRIYDEDRTTLAEVIGNAREKLEGDKAVTRRDAEKVKAAELQGDVEGLIGGHLLQDFPKESLTPGGVAEVVATVFGQICTCPLGGARSTCRGRIPAPEGITAASFLVHEGIAIRTP